MGGDDDIGKAAETARGQCCGELDDSITPCLRIGERIDDLLFLEDAVLQTSLIVTDALDHESLVFLGEAFGSHGRIRHVDENENAEEDGDDTVRQEQPLPGFKWPGGDQGEEISQQATNNLLSAIHHIPVGDSCGLLLAAVPHSGKYNEGRLAG